MSAATVATDDPTTPEDESRYGQQITTTLTHRKDNPYDCLAEAAIIFSTTVSDIEGDGIPDVLEVGSPFGGSGLIDPNGQEYPDLQAMGAVVGQRDFFAEINAMTAAPGTTYGSPTSPFKPGIQDVETDFSGHNHMPTPAVLRLVGEAQGRAGIAAHFDVGDAGAYKALGAAYNSDEADDYIIGAGGASGGVASLARGGESIVETHCTPQVFDPITETFSDGEPWCQFPDFPGTVSWKLHFQLLRDAWVRPDGTEFDGENQADLTTLQACVNAEPGSAAECRRRFDPLRNGLFRFLLYAHARGMARQPFPCLPPGVTSPLPDPPLDAGLLDQLEAASFLDENGLCDTAQGHVPNPEFHAPQRVSGVADLPGFNAMVSLGLSKNFVGTEFFLASTTLHEFGHTVELWHGGDSPTYGPITPAGTQVVVPPNCKPTYFSSQSYLYQLAGLVGPDGVPRIDYSSATSGILAGAVDETNLFDGAILSNPAPTRYRTAWFAPLTGNLSGIVPEATRHCDGSPLLVDDAGVPFEPPTGRLEAATVSGKIDWAGDDPDGPIANFAQDVNFDGSTDLLQGFNDVDNLRLDQAGGGHNAAGLSTGIASVGGSPAVDGTPYAGGVAYAAGAGDASGLRYKGGIPFDAGLRYTGGLRLSGGLRYKGGTLYAGGISYADGVPYISGRRYTGGLRYKGGLRYTGGTPLADGLSFVDGRRYTGGLRYTGGRRYTGGTPFFSGAHFAQNGFLEIDEKLAEDLGLIRPDGMAACVIDGSTGDACPATVDFPTVPPHRIFTQWTAPNLNNTGFNLFRVFGTDINVGALVPVPLPLGDDPLVTTRIDLEELPNGQQFAYAVQAEFDLSGKTGLSTPATVTAENVPPVAVNDVTQTDEDTPVLFDVVEFDTDVDSANAGLRVAAGSIANVIGGTALLQGDKRTVLFTPPDDAKDAHHVLVGHASAQQQLPLESALEPLGGLRIRQMIGVDHLERHLDVEHGVPDLVDRTHAALPDQPVDAIPRPERVPLGESARAVGCGVDGRTAGRRHLGRVGIRHGDNNLQGFEVVKRCLHWLR